MAPIVVQAAERSSQKLPEGGIKTCTGQHLDLGAPQLTNADLKALTSCSAEVMPQLLAALNAQDWKVKVVAAHTLGLFGVKAQAAIPALSDLLQDENADIRFVAAQALGEIGTAAVVPALTQPLQDKDENVRVSAVTAFQQLGGAAKQAKPALIAALWDSNWFVRSRAAATVSKLSLEPNDIPAIVEPLRDNPEPENGAIVSIMLSIYPPVFNKLEDLPLFFIQGLQSDSPKVRESAAIALGQISLTRPGFVRLNESTFALQSKLEDQDASVRLSVLNALSHTVKIFDEKVRFDGRKNYTKAIDHLETLFIERLHDDAPSVRQMALQALKNSIYSSSNLPTTIRAALEEIKDTNPSVRQSAFDFLNQSRSAINTLSPSLKSQLLEKVIPALISSLYDEDASIRQYMGNSLEEEVLLPILIKILKQKNVNQEIRYDAIAIIAMRTNSRGSLAPQLDYGKSKALVELLEEALQDPDLGIRVNATHALERIGKIKIHQAIPIFIEGLKSTNLSIKFYSIFALHEMCIYERKAVNEAGCISTRTALPLLIDTLKENTKALRYFAALAIIDIDPREDKGINVLGEILRQETDSFLRDQTLDALAEIGSLTALSTRIQSLELEDKQTRYSRSYEYSGLVYTSFRLTFTERYLLLTKALTNTDIRFLAANQFAFFRSYETVNHEQSAQERGSSLEIKRLVSELISVVSYRSNNYVGYRVLQDIFSLKGQDLRRSSVYALGEMGATLHGNNNNCITCPDESLYPQLQKEIVDALAKIVANQQENLEIRWMAAAELQKLSVDMDPFFANEDFINPAIAIAQSRWIAIKENPDLLELLSSPYVSRLLSRYKPANSKATLLQSEDRYFKQYGYITAGRSSGIIGIDFDIYSKQYIYNNYTGGGAGLLEVYNTLQRLLNRQKKQ